MINEPYVPIRISTLRGDLPISFDVFVRVGDRYVAYCRRGTTFEGDRLARLQNKNLKNLHIMSTDQKAYDAYVNASLEAAYQPGQSLKIRAEVITGFQQAASERFMDNPDDEKSYERVRDSADRFVTFLTDEPFAVGSILSFANVNQSVSHHSVNVATLATAMLLKQFAPTGTPIQLMVLGCLLHDIDHYRTSRDVSLRPQNMTPEQKREYYQHPNRGAQLFTGSPFMDQLVLKIINQHEETMDGSGYPQGLTAKDMDPLVLVASVANAYDRLVSFDAMTPRDALKHLLLDKMGEYALDSLKTLQAVLKVHDIV